MEGQYNLKSPAVKRLMREANEFREPTEDFYAQPLEDNLFEWHFTVRGPRDTEFEVGVYHGRIILPPEYPMKPPSIILLTPNGRFELHKKVCLSISGHHPESWQPSWSIRTALLAIIGFMPTPGQGAIGSLDYSAEERKKLAKKSQEWSCCVCGEVKDILLPRTPAVRAATSETGARSKSTAISATEREISEIVSQMTLKAESDPSPPPPVETLESGERDPVQSGRSGAQETPSATLAPTSSSGDTRLSPTESNDQASPVSLTVPSADVPRQSSTARIASEIRLRQRAMAEARQAMAAGSESQETRGQVQQPARPVISGVDSQCLRAVVYYATLALLAVAVILLLFVRAAKQYLLPR